MPKRKCVGQENLVGQRVAALRKKRGLNQQELLAQLQLRGVEISQSGLSELEGQNRKVSDRELVALADNLGISVDELLRQSQDE